MPYIRQEARVPLDPRIDELAQYVNDEGQFNYVVTRLAQRLAKFKGNDYIAFNAVIGALESCKLEFYRRTVASYEDTKIRENGDV